MGCNLLICNLSKLTYLHNIVSMSTMEENKLNEHFAFSILMKY